MSDPGSRPRPWWEEDDYVYRPPPDVPAEPVEDAEPPPLPVLVPCWRCGKDVEEDLARCPFCHARLREDTAEERRLRRRLTREQSGLLPAVWFYLGLLVVSLVFGVIILAAARGGDLDFDALIPLTLVVQVIDTVLVVMAIYVVRPPALPAVPSGRKAVAWALAAPFLAVLLGVNFAYHWLLTRALGIPDPSLGPLAELTPLTLLIVCLQPAVVEELFFRYVAVGAFRPHMGLHATVAVSSVMFGVLHVFAPLSIPILTVVGMGLGYVRLLSGSLALPMVLHFAHNLVVLVLEAGL
jgi:uncharacterized protein